MPHMLVLVFEPRALMSRIAIASSDAQSGPAAAALLRQRGRSSECPVTADMLAKGRRQEAAKTTKNGS